MVTNCLPLYYVRPENHEHNQHSSRSLSEMNHELVRSSSTPAMNEQQYAYATTDVCINKHKNIHRQNSDVAAAIVASPKSPCHSPERRHPIPKPRKLKMKRSRSEDNIAEGCDDDIPYPYETVSVTFNDSAEKICRDNSNSPVLHQDLPPTPHTFELHFHSHSGWLVKLSKQKG